MLVQVGLVDILKAVGIEADGIVGHSVGELGCSYMDGSFTAEQMVLAAYYCGRASLETKLIQGLMAAVGRPVLCNFLHTAHSGLSILTVP
jgi:fatty acid synthase